MTNTEIFFFIWIGFATTKSIIVFATALDIAVYASTGNKISNIIGALISCSITSVGLAIFWPIFLYNQKSEFFKFPDKEYIKRLQMALQEIDKNNEQ